MNKKYNLKSRLHPELKTWLAEQGHAAYRADQLYRWVFREGVEDFSQMTNLAKDFRTWLADHCTIPTLAHELLVDPEDGTQKIILSAEDGAQFESVLIPDGKRLTLCLSSQVGCALDCKFCQTGKMGFRRDLADWEILEQIFIARRLAAPKVLTNLVFMGMGEPLLNVDNLSRAIRQLLDKQGFNISKRRITVSTAGIGGAISRIHKELGVLLAVSLNAADQELRKKLMPVGKKYKLPDLLEELRGLKLKARELITFEYILFDGKNDSDAQAQALARLLRGIRCKINLLSYNRVAGLPFKAPPLYRVEKFRHILEQAGYTATIRQSRGGNIGAACGQLGKA